MPDVRMPDGTIMRNVPEGTSREQIMRAYQKAQGDKRPKSFLQGMGEGFLDTATNALNYVERMPVVGMPYKMAGSLLAAATGEPTLSGTVQRSEQARRQKAPTRGSTAGRIVGQIAGTIPTAAMRGGILAQGAAQGALTTNDPNNRAGLARDIAIGAVANKAGQQVGKRVLAPIAERVGRTAPVRRVAEAAAKAVNRAPLPLPKVTKAERVVSRSTPELAQVRQTVQDAANLKLPFSLADADPRLRALGGSVARFSPDGRAMAEQAYIPRARGQADRAVNAIDEYLAPVTNIEQRAGEIKQAANAVSKPFYDEARAMPAPVDDDLGAMLRTPAGKDALRRAYTIAQNEGRDPAAMGFVLDEAGEVSLPQILKNEAGRYGKAPLGNEFDELTSRTVRAWNGAEIPKRGPIDMVGWLRLQGGLADQGGELGHMGLTNAPRRLDFVGQEARFGPLVNERGMNLDDAALRAWEAGYFPQHAERPSVNEFLDALRSTHEGRQRNFLPEDLPEVERFLGARGQKQGLQQQRFETGGTVRDKSFPAEERPFAPLEANATERQVEYPTFETLQLAKRGLDAKLDSFRNPITGKLDLEGNPEAQSIAGLLQRFNERLKTLNEPYKQGNAAYAQEIARREALNLGGDVAASNVPQRQFNAAMARQTERTLPEFQRGYATNMADMVNKQRLSRNPYDAVYGSTDQQGKVGGLFPEGAPRFNRQYELEGNMGETLTEVLRGSQTQQRNVSDQMFKGIAGDVAMDAVTGGVPGTQSLLKLGLRTALKDKSQLGLLGARKKADELAPMLFDTSNPNAILQMIDDMARKQREEEIRKQAYQRVGGLLGLPVAGVGLGSTR